jgi:hypothetical protein
LTIDLLMQNGKVGAQLLNGKGLAITGRAQ